MDRLELVVKKIDDLKRDVEKDVDEAKKQSNNILNLLNNLVNDIRRIRDDLNYHIKRTDLAEKRLKDIEDRLTVGYLLKLSMAAVAGIGTIAGTIYAVIKVIDHFIP